MSILSHFVPQNYNHMEVSKNRGILPNHPLIDGFSIINQPFLYPPFMETPKYGWDFPQPKPSREPGDHPWFFPPLSSRQQRGVQSLGLRAPWSPMHAQGILSRFMVIYVSGWWYTYPSEK